MSILWSSARRSLVAHLGCAALRSNASRYKAVDHFRYLCCMYCALSIALLDLIHCIYTGCHVL